MSEEEVLEFWKKNNIFSKTLSQSKGRKEYVFYEGPPTANASPGIHHLEARAFKDAIPRYKTMRGYHVRRKGGWDTHGLPVELQIEKKLGLRSKKEIEEYGIAKFNKLCRDSVWEYIGLWKDFTSRMAYWADQDNAYVTYHNEYIESVWNILAEVEKQKLLYKDYKVVPWCPRCGTALSSHELAQGYETVRDLSVTAKFKVKTSPPAPLLAKERGERGEVYFLAWTTTPWTLPGNVALAVGKDVIYVEVKVGEEILVLAKDRLSILENYEIVAEYKGSEMVGMQYEPLYPYLKNKNPKGIENAYKIYLADFVNTEEGTGIVHTAVMYGQDDFELGSKVELPKHHLVSPEGKFVEGTEFLSGRSVTEEETAVEIIKDLAHRGLLLKKEKYEHSYPFCWRCKTRLIYYARDSWYIRMSDPRIKNKLIEENKKINWEPAHIQGGRFGEWLRDVKDWAISRERYWGTPLAVWAAADGQRIVVDSVETLKKYSKKSGNRYFVLRHGEAEKNVKNIINTANKNPSPLTERGRVRAHAAGKDLRKNKIDLIFASPLLRTQETAKIVAGELDIPEGKIIADSRLIEIQAGELNDKPEEEYRNFFQDEEEHFSKAPKGGENLVEVKRRMGDFIYEIERKYKEKNILIVSHEDPIWMLEAAGEGLDTKGCIDLWGDKNTFIEMGGVHLLNFAPLPHNENFELDLHRPYIDEVVLKKDGKEFRRVKEVMDVWLDSGAMPFAQDGFPVNTKKVLYPADYISEAIDQTRGWFYTLHAVGILMGRGRAYENVICLGHLLDKDGKKMSKSLGNVVDPWEMMAKYGADTLRLWMYSVNQPGESKNFDEKTVQLLKQQVFGLLYNVLAFYELYKDNPHPTSPLRKGEEKEGVRSDNVLDQWILSRLNELINLATKSLDHYKLMEPTRAIRDFINDLSTWYLRRSRERIKSGDENAKLTLHYVLKTLAKVMAPFAPFAAEDIFLKLRNEKDEISVHLCEWPQAGKVHTNILENVGMTREIVSQGLEARQKAGLPVRQPLSELKVKSLKLSSEYLELIKEELNVKEVVSGHEFKLTTELTTELKLEGEQREFMRKLQDRRKQLGLRPQDKMPMTVEEIYKKYKIMPQLQLHMLRVAAVASLICDNFTESLPKEEITLACLLHDMGNIIKFDLSRAKSLINQDIDLEYWTSVQREYKDKYGSDEHGAALEITREIGVGERVEELVKSISFHGTPQVARGDDFAKKIVEYGDSRVTPFGVVPLEIRIKDLRDRYEHKGGDTPERRAYETGVREIEKQIFAKCRIKPEDITDEAVAPIIEELKNFVIE